MTKRHIGILALDGWAGGVMYTHNLVRALASLPDLERPEITLFYKFNPGPFERLLRYVDHHIAYRPWFDGSKSSKLVAKVGNLCRRVLAPVIGESQPSLARAARRAGVQAVFPIVDAHHRATPRPIAWIGDFQHRTLPEFFSPREAGIRDRLFQTLLRSDGDVVFSSEHARSDAIRFYGQPQARTHVFRFVSVPDPSWNDDPTPVQARYRLPANYLIVCNQFWIHKDHKTLFDAIHILTQRGEDVHLVCTGATDDYRHPELFARLQAQIQEQGIEARISILGMIPRYDQIMLMRGASAIVQPSLFEGWSTVLEDARVLGKSVIASDFPVHIEQNLPHTIYFSQGDSTDCARAILEHYNRDIPNQVLDQTEIKRRITVFARSFIDIIA
jgi:glycosyltransferase involved in cell wall biosynthesis